MTCRWISRVTGDASRASGSTVRENDTIRKTTPSPSRSILNATSPSPDVRAACRTRTRRDQQDDGVVPAHARSLREHASAGTDLRPPAAERVRGAREHLVATIQATLVPVVPVAGRELRAPRRTDPGIRRCGRSGRGEEALDLRGRGPAQSECHVSDLVAVKPRLRPASRYA